MTGRAVYYLAELAKTQMGEFVNGKLEGFGREEWPSKTYEGYFKNGKKSGEGVMHYRQPKKIYVGQWVDNTWHGCGYEFNLTKNSFRMADWRRGKLMSWLDKSQKCVALCPEVVFEAFKADQSVSILLTKLDITGDYTSRMTLTTPTRQSTEY